MNDDASPRLRVPWLPVVLVALLVGAVTFGVIQFHRAHSLASDKADRNAAASAAADVGEALFTYDYRHLDVTQQRLQSLATGAFAEQQASHNTSVQQGLVSARASGSASVGQVSVSPVHDGAAEAYVIVNSHATSTSGSTSSINYLHMSLQRVSGHWKVDAVQTLNPPQR